MKIKPTHPAQLELVLGLTELGKNEMEYSDCLNFVLTLDVFVIFRGESSSTSCQND